MFTLTPFHTEPGFTLSRPTPDFWRAWRESKDALKSLGYAVLKDPQDNWVVRRYMSSPTAESPSGAPVGAPTSLEIQNRQGLLPHQVGPAGDLAALMLRYSWTYDGSDMGTGKTYQSLAAAREVGVRVGVVAPLAALPDWLKVCTYLGVRPIFVVNWEGVRANSFPFGRFQPDGTFEWRGIDKDTILFFDEAHRAKGEKTGNARIVIDAFLQGVRGHLITATLAANPREMKASGLALGLHRLFNFDAWCAGLGGYQNRYNRWEFSDARVSMAEVHRQIFPARGVRVRIADIPGFPDTHIYAKAYSVDGVEIQNEQYEHLCRETERLRALAASVSTLEEKVGAAREAVEAAPSEAREGAFKAFQEQLDTARKARAALMTLNLRYRQQAEHLKVPLLIELAKDALAQGQSVVLFVNFEETRVLLQKALKCDGIHGGQTEAEREHAKKDFQADKKHAIVCNIQAGGVALSLHDTHGNRPRLALIAPTYSATDLRQVLGRVRRAGGMSKSTQVLVYAAGTVEEKECASVSAKLGNLDALMDGVTDSTGDFIFEERE